MNEQLKLNKKTPMAVAQVKISYKPRRGYKPTINCSEDAHAVFLQMWDKELIDIQEQFCVLLLNKANQVIGFRCLGTGSNTACIVDIQLLFSLCVISLAQSIIIGHNHPNGNKHVSKKDEILTRQVNDAANLLNIALLDHIILAGDEYVSLSDQGMIKNL